ncbi:MAG: hypothetical protein A4S09_04495 [Proteobacteria bacterium SG_bin7]|nr:MAG: hypothetical protein A4S09_04495 [Proteobacteria bacterium SG_bin7]
MKLSSTSTLIFILVFSVSVFAQEQTWEKAKTVSEEKEIKKPEAPEKTAVYEQLDAQLPSKNETWYTQWGVGLSSNKYEPQLSSVFTAGPRTQVAVDILGFYWPWSSHHTIHGIIVCSQGDSYTYGTGSSYSLSQSLLAYSIQHFLGANIGDGWFLRGDVGIASATETLSDGSISTTMGSARGGGIDLGGGYSWPISPETRFLLTGLLTNKNVNVKNGEVKMSSFSILASFLF